MGNNVFMAAWVPVDECLPEPKTKVLISFDDGSVDVYEQSWAMDERVLKYINEKMTGYKHVTAWMPLPDCFREVRHVEG